ncbi:DNA adenine methylase [Catenuloplanes nepalensis]|uniref:site-specific DNA-methyltransferase (adenine-specific) n=1 Tax=Catenuloplanes nepalensis TaxID=587533 RepID=A0ABT9MKT9_9ACTN|nr:DNA adenine methylase [Catenuloplanes nepalensis]MDP9791913.1 DNA adenine methylase [Catenuloplanes nepalensis]
MIPLPAAPRLAALRGVPHAIPYQGSKRVLAHAIVPLLPEGTADLIEPFAGSAAVSIAASHLGIPRRVRLRDVNGPLIALWRRILDEPDAIADDYAAVWEAQRPDPDAFYRRARDDFNAGHAPHLLLYLLARCVKASVRYNRHGEFNQAADRRRLGARPALMRARIRATSRALAGADVAAGDYRAPLTGAGPADVVYLDPPYQGVSASKDHRYMRGLHRDEFYAALRDAVGAGVSFLLSYDGSTGEKRYGPAVPPELDLLALAVPAGTSAQATLNGCPLPTVESLYVSPALRDRLGGTARVLERLSGGRPPVPPRDPAAAPERSVQYGG